jgi:hypothetical protein
MKQKREKRKHESENRLNVSSFKKAEHPKMDAPLF